MPKYLVQIAKQGMVAREAGQRAVWLNKQNLSPNLYSEFVARAKVHGVEVYDGISTGGSARWKPIASVLEEESAIASLADSSGRWATTSRWAGRAGIAVMAVVTIHDAYLWQTGQISSQELAARGAGTVVGAAREHGKPVFEAGEEWRGVILFAYCTGARLQDVANIPWSAIDLPAKLITYRAQKTGKLVTIPIHPALESHLLELPAPDTGKAFVFPKLAGHNTGGRSGLSMTFARIMARARIQGEVIHTPKRGEKGRTVRTLSFHSLRHSFNSAMANAGIAQEVRQKLTGHTSAKMNNIYTHLELEPLRSAIYAIPGPGGKAGK